MRTSGAAASADRMSSSVTWFAWGLAGVFFSLVALPLASSSPYPTPSRQDWSIAQPPAQMALASASTFSLASAASTPVDAETVALVTVVRTVSIRRPISDAPAMDDVDPPLVTASLGGSATRGSEPADIPSVVPRLPRPTVGDIDAYLWEVYQRQPIKKDRGGDFSWKDPAAARRMGKTLQAYVIMGMDADFRELIYHAGRAMDAAGVEWTIVSGFRDDWRQSIASGLKARAGYSRHGGSVAVGGYGHGRAIDIGHVEKDRNGEVWRWIDNHGAKYGLHRPYRFDPPHVEPRVEWRRLASKLRRERSGAAAVAETETRERAADRRSAGKRKVRNARVVHARGKPARNGRRVN
jgi:hypothetical protein